LVRFTPCCAKWIIKADHYALEGLDDPSTGLARIHSQEGIMAYLIAYLVCIVVMGGLDFLWLSNTSASHRDLGPLLSDNPNMIVAVTFYLVFIVGILIFAVRPALASGDWRTAAL
jgi:hypothetical protein